MHMLRERKNSSALLTWRRQVGHQMKARHRLGGREFAIVRFVPPANINDKLVDVRKLTVCILRDEFVPRSFPRICFASYRLAPTPWGLMIGGSDLTLVDKDLAIAPRRRAYGRHFAAPDRRWLPLALQLDECLSRHARHRYAPAATGLKFPRFWAALRTSDVSCEGPEFSQLCDDFGLSADAAMLTCERCYRGTVLYPLEFVSHMWREFTAIYADLQHFFLRQVIRLDDPDQLTGFVGACQYDLLSSPFRTRGN